MELMQWNIYSPVWARVGLENVSDGSKALALHDKDPFDYAAATRIIPSSSLLKVEFTVQPEQNTHGQLQIEFQDSKGRPAFRMAMPEYYDASCLVCHGGPKGEMDVTGYPKEGGKEGELGGVISITLYR